jgi:predicted nucleic acid-binding protein
MRVLLDNSVLQRVPRSTDVEHAVRQLVIDGHTLCSSPVSVLEAGYSARTPTEHLDFVAHLTRSLVALPFVRSTGQLAVLMQTALFDHGIGRAVGVMDLLSAACAVEQSAHLVHYDSDYEMLTTAWPEFKQTWIVARGSVN